MNSLDVNTVSCPQPSIVYDSFKKAVDAMDLIYLKPGHVYTAFYKDENSKMHCIVAVGNILPSGKNLIISDSGRDKSVQQQINDIKAIFSAYVTELSFNTAMESVGNMMTTLNTKLSQLDVELSGQINTIDEKLNNLIVQTNAKIAELNEKIDGITIDIDDKIDSRVDAKIVPFKLQIEELMSNLKDEVDTKISDVETAVDVKINLFEASVEGKINTLNTSIQELAEMIGGDIPDTSIIALFNENRYMVINTGSIGGKIYVDTAKMYKTGDMVTLQAVANENYTFDGWYKNKSLCSMDSTFTDVIGTTNYIIRPVAKTSMLDTTTNLNALFVSTHNYIGTLTVEGTTPTIEKDHVAITGLYKSSEFEGSHNFEKGNDLTFAATCIEGHDFGGYIIYANNPDEISNWNDLGGEPVAPFTIKVMNPNIELSDVYTDVSINAVFKEVKFDIYVDQFKRQRSWGNVMGAKFGDDAPLRGDMITITAQANEGYHFVGWYKNSEEGEMISTSTKYTFKVYETAKYYAKFEPNDLSK